MGKHYEETKVTYQQLVMQQIKIIQTICAKELREGTRVMKNMIGEQTIEGEDTRYSFLQSVEVLGSLLSPYFPAKDSDISENFDSFCKLYDMELIEAIKDEDFKKELETLFGEDKIESIEKDEAIRTQANIYFLNFKIKDARKIFRELVKLFKDNDFLAEESYGEGGNKGGDDNGMDAEEEEE